MPASQKAIFECHPHSQKSRSQNPQQNGIYWPDKLRDKDFLSICQLTTGQSNFLIQWLPPESSVVVAGKRFKYNVGNLIKVRFEQAVFYVSIAIPNNDGRNSYFQQVGPAYRQFLEESNPKKDFVFYALPKSRPDDFGRVLTHYHHFMYSILSAAGVDGNWSEFLGRRPKVFKNIDELVQKRNRLSKKNNNASYAYLDRESDSINLFLKTYGASKYESFFMSLAAINIEPKKCIRIFELEEGELTGLPIWASEHIESVSLGRASCEGLNKSMNDHRAPIILFPPNIEESKISGQCQKNSWRGSVCTL